MRAGADSSFAGTTADFNNAHKAGIQWWGHYIGGAGAYRVWSNPERVALDNSAIPYHLPIWVPAQSFTSNPLQEANQMVAVLKMLGYHSVVCVDVEENSGYTLAWGEANARAITRAGYTYVMYHTADKQPPSVAHSWLASWVGNPPQSLSPDSAQQYRGGTAFCNMNVDFDIATDDFPLEGLTVKPPTHIGVEEDMVLVTAKNQASGKPDLFITGGAAVPIAEVADIADMPGWLSSIEPWPVSDATYANFEKLVHP